MNKKRIDQLAFMLSDITGIDHVRARNIIADSETGKLILDNNMTVMYEQQTENLLEVAMEMAACGKYQTLVPMLTVPNIAEAGRHLGEYEKRAEKKVAGQPIRIKKVSGLKQKAARRNLSKRKVILSIKENNQKNIRRLGKC